MVWLWGGSNGSGTQGAQAAEPNSAEPLCISDSTLKMKVELKDRSVTCVSLQAAFEAPHELVFDILSDPVNHTNIFSSIKEAKSKLLEETGACKTWSLDYKTAWKFWKVGGVCDTHCLMWTNRDLGTVRFRLREPGFLKVYEGTWTIRPGNGLLDRDDSSTSLSSADSAASSPSAASSNGTMGSHTNGVMHVPGGLSNDLARSSRDQNPSGGCGLTASVSMQNGPASHPLGMEWIGEAAAGAAAAAKNWMGQMQGAADGVPDQKEVIDKHKPPAYTVVTVEKMMAPRIQPPYPLNLALKNNAAGQIQEMVESLISAAQQQVHLDKLANVK